MRELPREAYLGRIEHPLGLHGAVRVDHPVVDAIQQGIGWWEGDPRLALYADAKRGMWLLYRLEHDGVYRLEGHQRQPLPGQRGMTLGEDLLNTILTHYAEHDLRRGFDPIAQLDAHNDAREAQLDAELSDFAVNDFADRFRFALRKELNHVSGVRG